MSAIIKWQNSQNCMVLTEVCTIKNNKKKSE